MARHERVDWPTIFNPAWARLARLPAQGPTLMNDRLTHLDDQGRANMVKVGKKPMTHRVCVASGELQMKAETLSRICGGEVAKGDVFATARVAGIQAAKRTPEWIPLAHPLPLDTVAIEFIPDAADASVARLRIEARAETYWRTGVEMEALVAVSAAALTIYDMCKAIDRSMTLSDVRLMSKSGGKSGDWSRSSQRVG